MQVDKLIEKNQANLKAMEDAKSDLHSMLGYVGSESDSVASKMALQSVLDYLKLSLLVEQDCLDLKQAEAWLQNKSIPCLRCTLEGKWWSKAAGPLLCIDENGKIAALIPNAFGYRFRDVKSGKMRSVSRKNASSFGKNALSVVKPLPSTSLTIKDLYAFIIKSVPIANRIAVVFFCVIATLLTMLVPVANKIIFKEVVPSGLTYEILPVCALLFGAGISSALFGVCNNVVLLRAKDKVNAMVQPALMSRLLYLPSSFFKKYSSGELSTRVLSVTNAYQLLTNQILVAFEGGIFSIMYVLIAFVYAKEMMWVITLTVLSAGIFSFFEIRASIKEYNKKLPNAVKTQNFSKSAIAGIQKIKNNRAEARVFAQWTKRFSQSEVRSANSSFFMRYKKGLGCVIANFFILVAYFAAWYHDVALSDYVAFMSAFAIMQAALDNGRRVLDTIARISPQLKLLEPILAAEPENKSFDTDVNVITGSIDLNHVSFVYGSMNSKLLDDVSLHIPAGQSVGLVGSSGCGKSTLMRVMMGFDKPSGGSVYYGQYNVHDVNIAHLRQFVGYCPQNLQIFPGTVEENIRMGYTGYSKEEIWKAAEAACIADDLRRMPKQLDTELGEGGTGLSGGQCQRLLIARALLNKPKILFLDEATSALDNITQKGVSDNIDKMGCTRIMIAHRLSTVMNCDRIIVLDNGKIVEDGSPRELMAQRGFFYQLSKRQM